MKVFRWLVVVSVVVGTILGGAELAFALFLPPFHFASNAGASGATPTSQLPGQFSSPLVILVIETVSLAIALLSGVMYSVSGRRAWQIALWAAAIMLLLPSALTAFSFVFGPSYLPAAIVMLLAALFSLGVRQTTDVDVERQPLVLTASRRRAQVTLGAILAFLGGTSIIFLLQVTWLDSWVAILIVLAVSSIGATLLIRSPLSALVVPAAIWFGAMIALIFNGISRGGFNDSTFWWGALEFAGIFIVIAVIPALIGVGIGSLLTRWIPGASAA